MILQSFEIDSYRSCIRTKFPIQDNLTSLIGSNGAGKSNILNAIVLLKKIRRSRPPFIDTDDSSSRNICRIAIEVEHEGKSLFIRGKVIYDTDERNIDEVYSSNLRFNFREFSDYSKWIDIPIQFFNHSPSALLDESQIFRFPGMYGHIFFKGFGLMRKSRKIRELVSKTVALFDGINYYSASQFSDPSRCPVSIELEEGRPLRRIRTINSHEQFIYDLYSSYKASGTEYKRYINTIGRDGIGLIDGIDFREVQMPSSSYKVKPSGEIEKYVRNRLLIVPRFTVNNTELSPNQLSEGSFKTLALIYYILNDDSKLLLIEEPEVCVHHGLLSSIMTLIQAQSKRKQIIMSTHSDFVLDHLVPENLLLVKWSQAKGTIATTLTKSLSKNDFQALRIYLKDLGNLGEYWKEGGFENG